MFHKKLIEFVCVEINKVMKDNRLKFAWNRRKTKFNYLLLLV